MVGSSSTEIAEGGWIQEVVSRPEMTENVKVKEAEWAKDKTLVKKNIKGGSKEKSMED